MAQHHHETPSTTAEGILLVNKPRGKTAFSLVARLRKILNVKKIGHAGTLDPFATGLMVLLIGKAYTRLSDSFLGADKEYIATLHLGTETDSYDCDGQVTASSTIIPTEDAVKEVLKTFQGSILQTPPMFSAKKKDGKKLYELARKGVTIEREAVPVRLTTTLLDYAYPLLKIHVTCSKGTYIRSIANDMGKILGCGAHLSTLERLRSGSFTLDNAIDGSILFQQETSKEMIMPSLQRS